MSFLKKALGAMVGKNDATITPAEKAARDEQDQAKREIKQQAAIAREITRRAEEDAPKSRGRAARPGRPTAPTALLPDAAVSLAPVRVVLPTGGLAEHPWQALRPEGLSPLYATLDGATMARLLHDADPTLDDPEGRILDHISPVYAEEGLAYYRLDDRFYTTLYVKSWGADFAPQRWSHIFNYPSTVSLHYHRIPAALAEKAMRGEIEKAKIALEEMRAGRDTTPLDLQRKEDMIGAMEARWRRLVAGQETLFHVAGYLRVGADSLDQLKLAAKMLAERANKADIVLANPLAKQRAAFVSSMPYSRDLAKEALSRTATEAAQFWPFISREHVEHDEKTKAVSGVLYGIHLFNRTPIIVDPWLTTSKISAILGEPGAGKSFWMRTHLGRVAMVGAQVIVIDPYNDHTKWMNDNGGQVINLSPRSTSHINPLKVRMERWVNDEGKTVEETEDITVKVDEDLQPLFELLLGDEYTALARGLIGSGLKSLYKRYGTTEKLMGDFIAHLREINAQTDNDESPEAKAARGKLIDLLGFFVGPQGAFAEYFNHPTNVGLRNRLISFNLKDAGQGLGGALACHLATTMAVGLASETLDKKIIVVDEIWRLFKDQQTATAIQATLKALVRTHRHWNTAILFGTQMVTDDDSANQAQLELIRFAKTWILMRGTEEMLRQAAKQVGEKANLDLLLGFLESSSSATSGARPAIMYRDGVPVPMLSVGFRYEEQEDDTKSAVRSEENEG